MPNKGIPWRECMWKMSDGKSVMSFCNENKVNYSSVMNHIEKGNTVDEACRIALEKKGDKTGATKYFINGMSLIQWCRENNENYRRFWNEINKRRKLWKNLKN